MIQRHMTFKVYDVRKLHRPRMSDGFLAECRYDFRKERVVTFTVHKGVTEGGRRGVTDLKDRNNVKRGDWTEALATGATALQRSNNNESAHTKSIPVYYNTQDNAFLTAQRHI